jgi:membrane protein implicated in regulation of membrane protease activity
MPEDIPKAVMILIWLLVGVIIFGWLLMKYTVLASLVFVLVFFILPVLIYNWHKKQSTKARDQVT